MKKAVFILLMFPLLAAAQFKTNENGGLYFEKVYQAENLSQQEIKEKVNEWIAVTYNDANSVIKMNTDSRIVTNGLFNISYSINGVAVSPKISYSFITDFKEGRYKVLVNNLTTSNIEITSEMSDFEEFKKEYRKIAEGMSGPGKRAIEKQLKDEDKLREVYEQGKVVQEKMSEGVKTKIEAFAEDLHSYVQESAEELSDW